MALDDDILAARKAEFDLRQALKEAAELLPRAAAAVKAVVEAREVITEIHGLIKDMRRIAAEQDALIRREVKGQVKQELDSRVPGLVDAMQKCERAILERYRRIEDMLSGREKPGITLAQAVEAIVKLQQSTASGKDLGVRVVSLEEWEGSRGPWTRSKRPGR